MLLDIPTKNPAKLKEWLDGLPVAEKGGREGRSESGDLGGGVTF